MEISSWKGPLCGPILVSEPLTLRILGSPLIVETLLYKKRALLWSFAAWLKMEHVSRNMESFMAIYIKNSYYNVNIFPNFSDAEK